MRTVTEFNISVIVVTKIESECEYRVILRLGKL